MRLFLCGDVMTGRGIDQVLPRPGDPALHESWVHSALHYVDLAERRSGAIAKPVPFGYVWGDALAELDRRAPQLRIVNLETSITAAGTPEPKGINYRMHPGNVGCITAAGIDCCVLANNHLADWGPTGIVDTLAVLDEAGIATAGAGRDATEAAAPAVLDAGTGTRTLVFAFGLPSSGVPAHWAASPGRPGVNFLPDIDERSVDRIAGDVARWVQPGDLVVVSLHWGSNWGYDIPIVWRQFAHALVADAGVHVLHGHSSHHPRAVEVHRGRPIMYGCGDFINDYEGIGGYEAFRGDLVLAYFLDLDDAEHTLQGFEAVPFQLRRFRLQRASAEQATWLSTCLDRQCRSLGAAVSLTGDGTLGLSW
ncbi:MAG TPA: CapA family protein [Gammaproteobacteria bacterium]|nr:CapA family protein [Gammaproteobacteria bacterium]